MTSSITTTYLIRRIMMNTTVINSPNQISTYSYYYNDYSYFMSSCIVTYSKLHSISPLTRRGFPSIYFGPLLLWLLLVVVIATTLCTTTTTCATFILDRLHHTNSHYHRPQQRHQTTILSVPPPLLPTTDTRMNVHQSQPQQFEDKATNYSDASSTIKCGWEEYREQVIQTCILPLSYDTSYKGSSGRVAIIGGNELYVGAPYFAGMASLQTGVDLVSIYTAQEATIPIKCFSPDLMVQSIYQASELPEISNEDDAHSTTDVSVSNHPTVHRIVDTTIQLLQQRHIHCVVIGPGMGRHPIIMAAMAQIIQQLTNQLYLILDADALYMLSLPQYCHILNGNTKVILTPNKMEYERLFHENSTHHLDRNDADTTIPTHPTHSGWDAATIIVQKGLVDRIYENHNSRDVPPYKCSELGGMKRCGGIGDVLAGTIATFVAWQAILMTQREQKQHGFSSSHGSTSRQYDDDQDNGSNSENSIGLACYAACCLVKRATKKAYDTKHRAMRAQDVIDEIGPTFQEMMTPMLPNDPSS